MNFIKQDRDGYVRKGMVDEGGGVKGGEGGVAIAGLRQGQYCLSIALYSDIASLCLVESFPLP